MELQEKSFRNLQHDKRLKKLERHLKLIKLRRSNCSQLPTSPHMSISGISSIHGDNPLSDFSFCSPSSVPSSRAGSVILSSSLNLRNKLSKNLKPGSNIDPTTLSIFDENLEKQSSDNDRIMMPPPSAIHSHKLQSSVNTEPKGKTNNSAKETLVLQSYENPTHINNSPREEHCTDCNVSIENDAPKELSRTNNTSKQYGRVFKKWTIRLNNQGQIIIKGKLESGEQARSKAVKRRLSATTVLSVLNHKYHLVGEIHDLREELPEYVRGKFYNGFPTDWENVRQMWQGYLASGSSSKFRWPRPIADSDDDLRSDITDLTVSHSKNARKKPAPLTATSRPSQTAIEMDRSSRQEENHSLRRKVSNNSDIPSIHSAVTADPDAQVETLALKASCENTAERTEPVTDNNSVNHKKLANKSVQTMEREWSSCGNIVSRRKIDIIVDNLANKNCSREYVDKFIEAVNCFNELFAMPVINDFEISPDNGLSVTSNCNDKTDITSKKNSSEIERTEMFKNVDSSEPQHSKHVAVASSNSYSLESCEESEDESPCKYQTFLCEKSGISRENNPASHTLMESQRSRNPVFEPKTFSSYSNLVNRKRNSSTPVSSLKNKFDTRQSQNEEHQVMPTPAREEIVEKSTKIQHKRKTVFDTDSDTEGVVSSRVKTIVSTNNSLNITTNSQRALGARHRSTAIERIDNGVAKGATGDFCDSDVSIIDMSAVPRTKPKISYIEKTTDDSSKCHRQGRTLRSNFSFRNVEKDDRIQGNSPELKGSGNLSNEKLSDSTSAKVTEQQSTVRLTKITTDQRNPSKDNCMPSGSEKPVRKSRRQKSRIETDCQTHELVGSDLGNFNLRTSSRGRRILPPLDYWNGERVILKGRELIYSPGTCCPASTSGNSNLSKHSLTSPNATAVSDPVPGQDGILLEISEHHDKATIMLKNKDHTSNKILTRGSVNDKKTDEKNNKKTRSKCENSDSSSDDGGINLVRRRKKRRID